MELPFYFRFDVLFWKWRFFFLDELWHGYVDGKIGQFNRMRDFSLLTGRNIIALAAIYKRNEIISFVHDFMNGMLNAVRRTSVRWALSITGVT